MDNLWAEDPATNDIITNSPSTSWNQPQAESSQEPAPSWSTDVKWSEPTLTEPSVWSQTTDSGYMDAWESTYNHTHLPPGSPSQQDEDASEEPLPHFPVALVGQNDNPPLPLSEKQITRRTPSPPTKSPGILPSSDTFGSFEAATDTKDVGDPWSSATAFSPDMEEVDQWGSAWTASKVETDEVSEKVLPDEWELARQRKENMDRQVVSNSLEYVQDWF